MAARSLPVPRPSLPSLPALRPAVLRATSTITQSLSALLIARLRSSATSAAATTSNLRELARREGIPRLVLVMLFIHLTVASLTYYAEVKTFVPQFEGHTVGIDSLGKAFWWAIVTMTSTGYGDIYPWTPLGRMLGSFAMASGVLTIGMFTASFASMLVSARLQEAQGLTALKVKGHTIIIGWNRSAESVIQGLIAASSRRPQIVLINQLPAEQLQEIKFRYRSIGLEAIRGDATHEAILGRASLSEAASVLLLADSTSGAVGSAIDDRTLFVALAVRDANAEVKMSAELTGSEKESAIRHAGVEELVISGADTSFFLASASLSPGLARAARQLLTYGSGREMRRVEIPRELRGVSFRHARQYFRLDGALLVGILVAGRDPITASQ